MFQTHFVASLRRHSNFHCPAALLALAIFFWTPVVHLQARPPETIQATTDRVTYNAGETVRIKIVSPALPDSTHARYLFSIRYLGDEKPVAENLSLGGTDSVLPGYHLLWRMPVGARLADMRSMRKSRIRPRRKLRRRFRMSLLL